MAKFYVEVVRVAYASRTIVVEAADGEEAYDLALNTAGDYEYREISSDYTIESCREGI